MLWQHQESLLIVMLNSLTGIALPSTEVIGVMWCWGWGVHPAEAHR